MLSFYIHASSKTEAGFVISGALSDQVHRMGTGEYCIDSNPQHPKYEFRILSLDRDLGRLFTGFLSDIGRTLSGTMLYDLGADSHHFIFKRIQPEIMCCRPSPSEFFKNKAKALWKYALTAVLDDVRRHSEFLSWSYIKSRRTRRKLYIKLQLRQASGHRPSRKEKALLAECRWSITASDARLYALILEREQRLRPKHRSANQFVYSSTADGSSEVSDATIVVKKYQERDMFASNATMAPRC